MHLILPLYFSQIISLNVITNNQACVKNDKNIIVLTSLIHIFETFKEDIIRLCGLFQSVFILGVASWAGKVDQWFTNWYLPFHSMKQSWFSMLREEVALQLLFIACYWPELLQSWSINSLEEVGFSFPMFSAFLPLFTCFSHLKAYLL